MGGFRALHQISSLDQEDPLGQLGLTGAPRNESRAGSDFPIQPYRQPLGEGGNLPSGGDSVCAQATTSLRLLFCRSARVDGVDVGGSAVEEMLDGSTQERHGNYRNNRDQANQQSVLNH